MTLSLGDLTQVPDGFPTGPGEFGDGFIEPRLGPIFLPLACEAGLHRAVRSTTEALDEVPPPTLEDIAKREEGAAHARSGFFFEPRKSNLGPWSSFGPVALLPAEVVQGWSSVGPIFSTMLVQGWFSASLGADSFR